MIKEIDEQLRKSSTLLDMSWTGAQLATPAVRGTLDKMFTIILAAVSKAKPPPTDMAVAYTVWRLLKNNERISRIIGSYFFMNDRDEGVAFSRSLSVEDWLTVIFGPLTGIDYDKRHRERSTKDMGLPDFWTHGLCATLTDLFIATQDETELSRRTKTEVWSLVRLLVESTGFCFEPTGLGMLA